MRKRSERCAQRWVADGDPGAQNASLATGLDVAASLAEAWLAGRPTQATPIRHREEPQAMLVHDDQPDVAIHDLLGFRLLLDRGSLVDRAIVDTGEWEHEQLDYFVGLIERIRGRGECLFIDVGAYWGLYTLVAHRSAAFGALYAIEADRHNFAQLQANLFLNNASAGVTSVNKAAGHDEAPLFFRDSASHADGNRAGTSVLPHDTTLPGRQVPASSIDALLQASGAWILLKIDVEGFEANVLRGMAQTVRDNRVLMQVEVFDAHKAPAFDEIARLGLRQIHCIYPDYYLTNIPAEELGL
jgi:FkbM family methyltransferase